MLLNHQTIENMDSATGFVVLNTSTDNLVTGEGSVYGTANVQFDKINGASALAGVYRTITDSIKVDRPGTFWRLHDIVGWLIQIPVITNVAYTFARLGTDASNYCEWRVADTALTAARFTLCHVPVGNAYVVGEGWNPAAVTYAVVGVAFDQTGNTLAAIQVDALWLAHADLVNS